jgi:hypothetical protein
VGAAGGFFGYRKFVSPRFFESDVLCWMAIGGVLVDAGEAARE